MRQNSKSCICRECLYMNLCMTASEVEGDGKDQSQPTFLYIELQESALNSHKYRPSCNALSIKCSPSSERH
jgi:hypothetical protein